MTKEQYVKILKGAGIAAGGALLTYLAQVVSEVNFGQYTLLIAPFLSVLINAALKWVDVQVIAGRRLQEATIDTLPDEPS